MVDSRAAAPAASPLSLHDVALRLPTGRVLFEHLSHRFSARRTGLIGRNGIGKSMLARLLGGRHAPERGKVEAAGSVLYLPQHVESGADATTADVAGVGGLFAAWHRVVAGHGTPADLDMLDGRWTMADDFAATLREAGLPHLAAETPAAGLSGGELARVALAGAFLSGAGTLVLDEPTNHLDRAGRAWLLARLQQWPGAVIAVSHDRELLDAMDEIVELDERGLHAYGGNYTLYRRQRDSRHAADQAALQHVRAERQAALRTLRQEHDARQQRSARAANAGRQENQAAILLGRRKSSAQASAGRASQRADALRERLDDAVRSAAARTDTQAPPALLLDASAVPAGRIVVACEGARAPWPAGARPLDLLLAGPVRLAIEGPNGCGKSTLLKMLAGVVVPLAGSCAVPVSHAWLDQHAATLLPPDRCVLARLHELGTPLPEPVLRSHLALLGLDAARAGTPAGQLSGGERLKAALACALWRADPAQMLLLDEPGNHLDLPSLHALEAALLAWPGAFAIVSHDTRLLQGLRLTHVLAWHPAGWQLRILP